MAVNKKYQTYQLEELLDDRDFIAWILHSTNQQEWETFLQEHPGLTATVSRARNIVKLLETAGDKPSEEDILRMWRNIDHFDEQMRKRGKMVALRQIWRYAAVAVVLLTLGGVAFWLANDRPVHYRFVSENVAAATGDARLVLATGEEIPLKKDNSRITIEGGKTIQINNDSLIALQESTARKAETVRMNEVIVPYGKKTQLVLADGTKVWLNAGSRLAFPSRFEGKSREVFLEGEAYLEVVQNAGKPFRVNTKEVQVKVLGTRFNVSAYSADPQIETILIEGKVSLLENRSLAFGKREVILAPFQKARFSKQNQTFTVNAAPDADRYVTWTEGWFSFSKENLANVLKKLERYYNVRIECNASLLASERITGKLDLKESLQEVMVTLADVAPITYRIEGNAIKVEPRIGQLPMK